MNYYIKEPVKLAVDPQFINYTSSDEKQLIANLNELDRHSITTLISDPAEIRLKENGRTLRGNFHFSTLAMKQLCQYLCPGLSKLAFTVSGLIKDHDSDVNLYSVPLAVATVNNLINLRFPLIKNKYIVRNTKTATIDGITGNGYLFFSNRDFFEKVKDLIPDASIRCQFDGAILYGRKLTVNYKHNIPSHIVDDFSFNTGFSFTNAETGDCSVRAMPIVLVEDSNNYKGLFVRSKKRWRVIHSGKNFSRKILNIFTKILSEDDYNISSVDDINEAITIASESSLGFGTLIEEQHKALIQDYIKTLCGFKLTESFAKRVVNIAIYNSRRDILTEGRAHLSLNNWRNRTVLHLVTALAIESRKLKSSLQEAAENTAYKLLFDLPEKI